MPRFGPQFDGPAGPRRRRDEVPRRAGGGGGRRDAGRRRGGRRASSASSYEELPAVVTLAAALAPGAPLVQDPSLRPGRPAGRHQRLQRAPRRLGRRRRRAAARPRRREHLHVPDGHPLRHRAARVHGRARRRRHRRLERHPAPLLAAAGPRPGARAAARARCASSRPTRAAPSAASSTPSTSRCVAFMALELGRPVRLVLTLEETFQAVRRAAAEVRVRTGLRPDGTHRLPGHRLPTTSSAPTPTSPTASWARAATSAAGPYNMPAARIVARSVLSHTVPSTAFRGFGNPQVNWAVESNLDEGARRSASTGSTSGCATWPARASLHPLRHAGRRRLGADASGGPPS